MKHGRRNARIAQQFLVRFEPVRDQQRMPTCSDAHATNILDVKTMRSVVHTDVGMLRRFGCKPR